MQKSKIFIISIIIMSFLCGTISSQYRYSKEVTFQALNTTPKTSQPDGTLKFATTYQPSTIDPIDGWDTGSFDVIRQVTETLFWNNYSNPSLASEPLLVESFYWDITNTELTLILKQGIFFHDGHELDAAAVKWNVDRWLYFTNSSGTLPPGTPYATPSSLYYFPDGTPIIYSCSINDAYNLTITLTQPFGPFIEFLCFEANSIISPFSHSPTEYIDLYSGDLIGTGPFTFTHFIPGIEVWFERFDGYWRDPSEIETLIFIIIFDSPTRNNMLLTKDVHIINGYDNALLPTFVADPEIHVEFLGTDLNYWYLGFNSIMINRTWREALSYAFDYTYVIETILYGEATRGCPAVPQAMPGHNASVQANLPTMDIPYARSIMQSMGFGIGWDTAYPGTNEDDWALASFASSNFGGPLELNAIENNIRNEEINTLASYMWQLIGVDTVEIVRTFVDFLNLGYNTPNDLQVWYLGWAPDFLDAYNMLNPLFNPNSDANFGQVDIPIVNSLLSDAAIETDVPTRLAIYEQLQYILFLQEFVNMPLFANIRYAVHLTTLLDFPYNQANTFYFYPCSIADLGPGPFTLTSDAEDPDLDGSFTLSWTEALNADNYTVYRHSSYITEINGSLTLLGDGITDLSLALSGYTDGTYYFIAVAHNAYGDTLSNCIEVVVGIPPGDFILSSNAGTPDDNGAFDLSWTSADGALTYSVYQYSSYITEINGSLTLLGDGITDLSLALSGYTDGTYYFIAVAHNANGDTLSNCIEVVVQIQPEPEPEPEPEPTPPVIPGYNLYFILVAIGIVSAITIRKWRIKKSEY